MKRKFTALLGAALLGLGVAVPAPAVMEWELLKTLPLEGVPLDLAVSADGQKTAVLLEGGRIFIYSADGKLTDSLTLTTPADRIAVSPRGERIFLSSGRKKTVQIIDLSFIQEISTAGSPFRGPAGASVAMAVFDDFQ